MRPRLQTNGGEALPEIVNTSALSFDSDVESEPLHIEDDRPTAIKIENVSMVFNMASERLNNLKEYFLKIVKHELFFEELVALDDISFEVKKGDVFGILGTNGSGKSTLLKIVAGVLEPTRGKVEINGAIAPLIELGAGFDMDLSARENIYLNGALLGYPKEFIQEHFDDIVEFAEVEKFLDMPMKNYSSGMVARIAFAIATVMVPEILIVDEVLSVGDFMFQQKCEDRITELIEKHGVTVLIVSHSNDQVERLCNKAIWIEKGHPRIMGDAKQVCNAYRVLGGRTGSAESESIVYSALKRAESGEIPLASTYEIIRGENHYATAANIALKGWTADECASIVLVPDFAHSISISASGIAGALHAPILPIATNTIPIEILHAIDRLSPSNVFIVGEEEEFSEISSILELNDDSINLIRIPRKSSGASGMLSFGYKENLWASDYAIMCLFSDVSSAFSASSLSYASCAPFLIPDNIESDLPIDLLKQLQDIGIQKIITIGSLSDSCIIDQLSKAGFKIVVPPRVSSFEPIDIARMLNKYPEIENGMLCIGSANPARWQDLLSIGSYAGKMKAAILLENSNSLDNIAECIKFIREESPSNTIFVGDRGISDLDVRVLLSDPLFLEKKQTA